MGGDQAYKGFGLALVLDMLAGGLSGGNRRSKALRPPEGNNVLFLVLDPARFAGREALLREATGLADYVRGTPRAEGVDAILLPGDPERRTLENAPTAASPSRPATGKNSSNAPDARRQHAGGKVRGIGSLAAPRRPKTPRAQRSCTGPLCPGSRMGLVPKENVFQGFTQNGHPQRIRTFA